MRHLDLFSGIGGFALATEMVWDNVEHIFCDNDPFSQEILKKHWPNSLIYGDIKELTQDRIATDTKNQKSRSGADTFENISSATDTGIDILTGGFPCQPFSAAGRRAGTEDDRHLWPEMLRVIRETNPTYVLGENVGGLLTWDGGLVLEMVLSDLESAGYEAGAFVIPACALNAPHRRDRVWIAAHSVGSDAGRTSRLVHGSEGEERIPERNQVGKPSEPSSVRDATNTEYEPARNQKRGRNDQGTSDRAARPDSDAADTNINDGRRKRAEERRYSLGTATANPSEQWSEDWPEVAAELCTLDDGLPDGLARPRGWRNAALKGAGNAIVPQVAAEIMRAIANIENDN